MYNFYSLLKIFSRIRSPWVKHVGVLAFYLSGRRYLGLFLDPTLGCNLRCRMCFFSGEGYKAPSSEQLSLDDYRSMAKAMFHRVMRLQIGCGAEPTLYRQLPELVRIGREMGIPHISLTTNGNLLDGHKLEELVAAGLGELILSVHGLTRHTYEYFMQHARFDRFTQLLDGLREVKAAHPGFRLRINYTVNEDNVEELALFPDVFANLKVDVLQVRPIQNLGDSAYSNFCLDKVKRSYDKVFGLLRSYAAKHGTTLIVPSRANLDALATGNGGGGRDEANERIQDITYVYGSPGFLWRHDFDFRHDSFEAYCKRTGYVREVLAGILPFVRHSAMQRHRTEPLNYTVK